MQPASQNSPAFQGVADPPANRASERFSLVLVKPSHYDDDGYVIQWFRSAVPANSLAVVYGLVLDCRERVGPNLDIDIHWFHPAPRQRPRHKQLQRYRLHRRRRHRHGRTRNAHPDLRRAPEITADGPQNNYNGSSA